MTYCITDNPPKMTTIDVHIVNAFTHHNTGGNPAAIVVDANGLTPLQKQKIAAKVGLSETAFVSISDIADIKLDFFTPSRQIAHCGHATIATFSYLREKGLLQPKQVYSKETIDGTRKIIFDGDEVFMEQLAPKFLNVHEHDKGLVIQAIGLQKDNVAEVTIINTGNAFLLIEVANEAILETVEPDDQLIQMLSEHYGLVGFYVFSRCEGKGHDASTRMFAPAYGIKEESATGMAAGPLACYLSRYDTSKTMYLIEQGRYMTPASVSLLKVQLGIEQGKVISVLAGGKGTLMSIMTVSIAGDE